MGELLTLQGKLLTRRSKPAQSSGHLLPTKTSSNGNERTASTGYRDTPQGERYTDFSAHGRRPDGTRDTGDALELASKVWGMSKGTLINEITGEMIKQGSAELESAARAGQPLNNIVARASSARCRPAIRISKL